MWLAALLICTTPDVNTCNISARPNELLHTESECAAVVESAVASLSPYTYYISGGCVEIGGYV